MNGLGKDLRTRSRCCHQIFRGIGDRTPAVKGIRTCEGSIFSGIEVGPNGGRGRPELGNGSGVLLNYTFDQSTQIIAHFNLNLDRHLSVS